MITRSQSKLAAAAADAPPEQTFRFLDLPKELRLMVYENLMDNKKCQVKFTAPEHLEVEQVYFDDDDMYYPEILQVSKLVGDEYWPLCLRKSCLWICYTFADAVLDDSDEEISGEKELSIPDLTEWTKIPTKVLDKVTEVIFRFRAEWRLPDIDPFSGVSICIHELPNLKLIGIWCEAEMSVVEDSTNQAEQDRRFHNFVKSLYLEEMLLYDFNEEDSLGLTIWVDCHMWTPLYEMNKNYIWPRRRHLQQGVAPLIGLPEWGYSMFEVHCPWGVPLADTFTYHGEELTFLRMEYDMPVPDRKVTECDTLSELDYEFDDSGWAIGNAPDRS